MQTRTAGPLRTRVGSAPPNTNGPPCAMAAGRPRLHARDQAEPDPHRPVAQALPSSCRTEATRKGIARLTGKRIETLFTTCAEGMGQAGRRSLQAALRMFSRFCLHQGYVKHRLDHAVPSFRTYKWARVPRGLSEDQAQAIAQAIDRHTPVGRRDHAIPQVLHTYGVRGGQVRALRLNDIRWADDLIGFRAVKHGKNNLLPLTTEVGNALGA